jgi:hypothetical protein
LLSFSLRNIYPKKGVIVKATKRDNIMAMEAPMGIGDI